MARTKTEDKPVQQSVHVDCPAEEAFELFVERFAEWWPRAELGEIEAWMATLWDPPRRLAFTWKSQPDETIEVVFTPEGDGTRVTLTHYGWQNAGVEMSCMAASFAEFAAERLAVTA